MEARISVSDARSCYNTFVWKKVLLGIIIIVAFVGGGWFYANHNVVEVAILNPPEQNSEQPETKHSLEDPSSLWVIVNKRRSLPINYTPEGLSAPNVKLRLSPNEEQMKLAQVARKDTKAMFDAAKSDGILLVFGSGYRSGQLQQQFYSQYVAKDGQKAADHYSARPGYSEHQTGLALDIVSQNGKCYLEICWAKTSEGKWVAKNAHRYGFIIRYPKGKTGVTGYQYEPWHLRYVGRDLSKKIYDSGQTLEEYFELEPAPDYN